MGDTVAQKEIRAERPDSQFVDEIRIVTVPRYKESELSGDEWRISGRIEFYRKGVLVGEQITRDVASGARFVDWFLSNGRESGKIDTPSTIGDYCDQEGCCKPWAKRFRLKKRFGTDGREIDQKWMRDVIQYRAFCEDHAIRGDCGLDDADANYEPMK